MDVEALFPFTPFPEMPAGSKTPVRHKRKRPANTTPTTATSAHKPHPPPTSARSSSPPSSHPARTPPPATTPLLSLPPRCPTPSCAHHGGLRALCAEWAYGAQYALTCPGCHAIVFPCDGCHQVAAHPAVSGSASHSACSECGFLTLISPQLRQSLRLPALLPLSSSATLSIQSSISLPLYQQHREAVYKSVWEAYKRAERASKRQQQDHEAEDGGESDTTDQPIRPAQRTSSMAKKQKKAAGAALPAGESTLLRRREELLAVNQLSSAHLLAPPSFRYGVQPLDSVPFTSHHLESLYATLLSLHFSSASSSSASSSSTPASAFGTLSSSALSSFHSGATAFFGARAELLACVRKVHQGWSVLQRVQRTYAKLETREHNSTEHPNEPGHKPTAMHPDDEADEHDEHKADIPAAQSTPPSATATTAASSTADRHHNEAIQRGVLAIVENVLTCRLQRTCDDLHARAAPHLPLLSAINGQLLPLYDKAQAALGRSAGTGGGAGVDGWACEVDGGEVDGGCGVLAGRVELLLWCCWLLRCCYCGVSSVLQRAVYWSEIVDAPQPALEASVQVTNAAGKAYASAADGGTAQSTTSAR